MDPDENNLALSQGLLGLGAGLLSGSFGHYGAFAPALGQGVQGFQQGYQGAMQHSLQLKEFKQRQIFQNAQITNFESESKKRQAEMDLQTQQAASRQQLYSGLGQGVPPPAAINSPSMMPAGNPSGTALGGGSGVVGGGAGYGATGAQAPGAAQTLPPPDLRTPAVVSQGGKSPDFWNNKDALRLAAAQAQAMNLHQDATFLTGLADKVEANEQHNVDKDKEHFTDSQGVVRYLKTGLPVAQQLPKAPEGFQWKEDKLTPIPEYWAQKEKVAAAGATNIGLFAPQAGVDAKGNQVFFQPSKSGGAPQIVPGVSPDKPAATDGERLASGFHDRMTAAEQNMQKVGEAGFPTVKSSAAGAIPMVGKYAERIAMTPEQQQFRQAQEDWVRAKLRKESGAAIGVGEMADEIRTYFPQPGDGFEVIAQKEQARKLATDVMKRSAGRAADKGPVKRYNPATGKIE